MVKTPNKQTPKKTAPAKGKEKDSVATELKTSSSDTVYFWSGLIKPGRATLVTVGFILFIIFLGLVLGVWPIFSSHVFSPIQVKDDPRVSSIKVSIQTLESLVQKQNRQEGDIQSLESQRSKFTKQLSDLIKRLEDQEKDMATVKKWAQATTPSPARQAANDSLERLSGRLADLEKGSDGISKVLERITSLEYEAGAKAKAKDLAAAKLSKSQSVSGGGLFSPRKTSLAILQLSHALRSSAPFAEDLTRLKELVTDQPEIKKSITALEPHMMTGIPTLVILRSKFELIAPIIIRANKGTIDRDWVDQTLDRLSSLVSIRKSGSNIRGNDVEAVLARAEENLKTADLPAALTMLKTLPEKSRKAAANWISSAKKRLVAEREIASLRLLLFAFTAPAQRVVDAPHRAKE